MCSTKGYLLISIHFSSSINISFCNDMCSLHTNVPMICTEWHLSWHNHEIMNLSIYHVTLKLAYNVISEISGYSRSGVKIQTQFLPGNHVYQNLKLAMAASRITSFYING